MPLKSLLLSLLLVMRASTMYAQATDPWTEYMMPSPVHDTLARYTGKYELTITMWMDTEQPPTVVKALAVCDTVLGGRFLEIRQTGNLMGFAYQSLTTMGFNTAAKKLQVTGITNMGTGILTLAGNWNGNGVSDVSGQLTNPVTKTDIQVRQLIRFSNNDAISIVNYDKEGEGPEKRTLQYEMKKLP